MRRLSKLFNGHVTRISMGASSYDEICVNCGATDEVPGGWGTLVYRCPKELYEICNCREVLEQHTINAHREGQ